MGAQSCPQIEIGVDTERRPNLFFVKDNGIGIEKQYQQRVFAMFERLNPTIEGTGIGLAIVKRVIEIHGGTIWVTSEGADQGCSFCMTLPQEPAL